jgi:large subunit ribosomal protein L35
VPKIKNVSGAKKRFRRTATGKLVHQRAGKSHILTKKSRKRKRRLKRSTVVGSANVKTMARCLPAS